MANVSQGVSLTWNGTALGEAISISVDGIAADVVDVTPRTSTDRKKIFSAADTDYGTISATFRGTSFSESGVGKTGTLNISGPGVSFSLGASIMESIGWTATVGELQMWAVTFKVGA